MNATDQLTSTFQELDLYDLDSLLTDEERMIRDHVNRSSTPKSYPSSTSITRRERSLRKCSRLSERWDFMAPL